MPDVGRFLLTTRGMPLTRPGAPSHPEQMQREYHSAWIGSDGRIQSQGDDSALFPWWSFTKTVIAVCALRLVEQGRLALDDLLPSKPYTLRQLLQHRSGVPDYGGIAAYHEAVARGEPAWPKQKLLEAVGPERLGFEPGEGWSYSNVGYLFVRELIEERAGRNIAAVISEFVCEPLGLRTVSLATTRSDFRAVHWTSAREYDPNWVYHGCLIGTAPEAARVLDAVIRGKLLDRNSLDAMLARHPIGGPLEGRPWLSTGYGLGVMSGEMDGVGRVVGHSGGGPGCVSAVYHFPDLGPSPTVACFTDGCDVGLAEFEAARIAARHATAIPPDLQSP